MAEIIKKEQFMIASKTAKAIGKSGMLNHLDKPIAEFFDAICKAVLNGDDEMFAIQWAISKLDEGEHDAVVKGKEEYRKEH